VVGIPFVNLENFNEQKVAKQDTSDHVYQAVGVALSGWIIFQERNGKTAIARKHATFIGIHWSSAARLMPPIHCMTGSSSGLYRSVKKS
jgi:hypothetical protein